MFITTSDGKIGFDSSKYLGHGSSENSHNIVVYTTDYPTGIYGNYGSTEAQNELRRIAMKEIGEQLKNVKRLEVTFIGNNSTEPQVKCIELEGIIVLNDDDTSLRQRIREALNVTGYFKCILAKFI